MQIKVKKKRASEIKVSPLNVRKTSVDKELDALIANIRKKGLLQPILLDEKGEVIVGQRRLKSLQELEKELVVLEVDRNTPIAIQRPMSREEKLVASLVENTLREQLTLSEIREAVKQLLEIYGSLESVSKATGIPTDWLQAWLSAEVVPPTKQERVDDWRRLWHISEDEAKDTSETTEESTVSPEELRQKALEKSQQITTPATGYSTGLVTTQNVMIVLPQPLYDLLIKIAKRRECSIQDLILHIIESYLRKYKRR